MGFLQKKYEKNLHNHSNRSILKELLETREA